MCGLRLVQCVPAGLASSGRITLTRDAAMQAAASRLPTKLIGARDSAVGPNDDVVRS